MNESTRVPTPVPAVPLRRRILTAVVAVGISAALVIWIVLRIESPEQVWSSIGEASLLPLLAIVPCSFLSHWLRATRWRRFIGRPVSRFYAFSSVMIGYAVNDVIPRGGEVARVVNMWRTTGTPAPSLIATLVAERILDVILLLGFLGFSLILEGDRISTTFPAVAKAGPPALLLAAAGAGFVAVLAVAGERLARIAEAIGGKVHARLGSALGRVVREGAQGLAIVRRPRAAAAALVETVAIWALYLLNLVLGLAAFHLLGTLGLGAATVWFSITSFSVMIPSQGAIGVYHKLGQESLHLLYGVDPDRALACVTVIHALLFLGVGGIGGAAVWGLQSMLRGRR